MMMKKITILFVVTILCSCNNGFSEKEKEEYTLKGKEIAQASFKALSAELMAQMKSGGPALAVPFCKEQARPILNEVASKYNVTIVRSSDQLRSCKIEPTEIEYTLNGVLYKMVFAEEGGKLNTINKQTKRNNFKLLYNIYWK